MGHAPTTVNRTIRTIPLRRQALTGRARNRVQSAVEQGDAGVIGSSALSQNGD